MAETNKTALLLDDDSFLLDLYAKKFEQNGFDIVKTNAPDEALEKLRAGYEPTAIVFDIVMPGMDGYGFLETLQKEKLAPASVKIALTNQTQPEDIERAKQLGADGYIAKASAIPSETVEAVLSIIAQGK
jgi:CheY-like chemotaxis protein